MTQLPVRKGISAPVVVNIPEEWSREWFREFITNFLVGADIRNVQAQGITISGNVSGNNTVAGSTTVSIGLTPIANDTVLGNISGTTAAPVALTEAQFTALINIFTATTSGAVPPSGGGTSNYLRADGTFDTPTSAGPIANNTVLGNASGGTANPVALTQTQLTTLINLFTSSLAGAVPASGGGTANYLRADGTWSTPPGGSSSPAGANTDVQFNNSGAFGGSANLTWNGSTLGVTGTVASTTFNSTSDPSTKKDMIQIKDSDKIVDSIAGYRFKWLESDKPSMGVKSTEIKEVAPELVSKFQEHDVVNYNGLVAVLIEEVKSLRSRIADLEIKVCQAA
jgi:hypothetical protein